MRKRKSGCAECLIPYNCSSCKENNSNFYSLICDECREETEELYIIDSEELCESCLLNRFEKITCEDDDDE